jgi:hypothetical protein
MPKLLLFLFLLSSSTIVVARQNTVQRFVAYREQAQAYSGKIGNNLRIAMEIAFDSRELIGRYQYHNKKEGEWLYLKGTIKGSKLFFTEEEELYSKETQRLYTVITGSFDGVMRSDSTITGTWKNKDGTKNLPFILTKERFDFLPDSIAVIVQGFSRKDCDCYGGSLVKIQDKRLSTYVYNKLNIGLNKYAWMTGDECPCGIAYASTTSYSSVTKVVYNRNNILTCATTRDVDEIHPWRDVRYSNYNLRTGERIEPISLFKPEALSKVQGHIIILLARQFEEAFQDTSAVDRHDEYDDYCEHESILLEEGKSFLEGEKTHASLYEFTLDKTNLNFYVDWHLPHLYYGHFGDHYQSKISIPYKDLLPWIDPKGALGFVISKK